MRVEKRSALQRYLWEQACVAASSDIPKCMGIVDRSLLGEVHLLGHCVAGDEHRSAELLMFDNSMFSVGLQRLA